jgi:hypothetical protein
MAVLEVEKNVPARISAMLAATPAIVPTQAAAG